MARKRQISPGFWETSTARRIGAMGRLLLLGCVTLADDEGLLRWQAELLHESLYEGDPDVDVDQVAAWMARLVSEGLVFVYRPSRGGAPIGYLVSFEDEHRTARPRPSTLGECPSSPALVDMLVRRDGFACACCGGPVFVDGEDAGGRALLAAVTSTSVSTWWRSLRPASTSVSTEGSSVTPGSGEGHVSAGEPCAPDFPAWTLPGVRKPSMGSVSRSQTATGRTGAAGDLEALSGLSEALDGPVRAVRPGAAVLWHSSCREAARQVVAAWPSVSEREAAIAACSSVWTWSAAASRERFLAVFDRPFDHVVTADAVSAHRAVREAAEVTVVQPSTVGPEASVDGVDGAVEPGAGTESTSSVGGVAKDPFTGSGNPADQGAGDALAEPSLGHLDGASHGASDGAVSGTSLGASEASIREVALRLLGSVALTDSDTADLTDPNSVGLTTDSVSPHGAGSRTPENGIVDGEKPALTCGNENSRPTHDKLSESSRPAHDTLTPASPPEREREGEVEMEGVNAERSRNAREAASERTAQTPGASPRTSACGAPKSTIDSTEEKTPHAARPEPSLSTPANPHSSTPSTAPQTDPHETTTATPAVPDATPVAGSTPAPAPTSPPVSGEAAGTSQPVSPRSDAPIETPEAATEPPRHEQAPNGHSPSSPSGDQPQEGADMTPSPHGTLTEPSVSETVDPNSQAAQDGLFDMAPVEPPQPKPKRNPPATWTAERKEQAHAILRPWFEKYGSTTAQSYGVIFGVLISAMKNGMSPEDLTRAMEILAADRMTISGGTINIALAKGSKTQREDERVAAQQALTSPETYTRTTW